MDYITLFLGAQFLILFLIYYYLTKNFNYWQSKGVICRKPVFLYGNIKDRVFLKISFPEFVRDFYNEFKENSFAGIYEGTLRVLYVFDPELIKVILIKKFDHFTDRPIFQFRSKSELHRVMASLKGSEWKKTRVACTPAFSSGRLKAMVPLIDTCGQQMFQHLNKILEEQSEVILDIKLLLIHYTLDVIASTSFGLNLNSFSDNKSEFVQKALQFQDISILQRILLLACIMFEVPTWITKHLPVSFLNRESVDFFTKILSETRNKRINSNIRRNDLLQLLLDAEIAPIEVIGDTDEEIANEKRELLDEATALAQAVFFFIAGFETSSTQLSMLCYELAKNQDVQKKARKNVMEHWEDGVLTYEKISSMTYLDMVLYETLRLYPPVPRLERSVTKPINLGGVNLDIGTIVAIPVCGLHYDAQHYPDPTCFKPERFTQEEKVKRHPNVFLGFGDGPRNCIGRRFSSISSKICTAYLLKHFEIDVCDQTPIPFEFNRRTFLLKAKAGVHLKLRRITLE